MGASFSSRLPAVTLAAGALAAGALAATALAPSTAHALPGPGRPTVSLGFIGGYGFEPSGVQPNPYGAAMGARVGISLYDVYLGTSFFYHFGSSNSVLSTNVYTAGGELGYDVIPVKPLVIRPYVSFGALTQRIDTLVTLETSRFYGAPGLLVLAKPYGALTVGVDARFVMPVRVGLDRQDLFSFGLFGTAGAAF